MFSALAAAPASPFCAQPYAQETYGVQLNLSSMTACAKASPKNLAFKVAEAAVEPAAPMPAPTPAAAPA